MSKMSDSIIDVPVNDSDYDYQEDERIDVEDMMVGVSEEEKFEGDTLSFSPEEI